MKAKIEAKFPCGYEYKVDVTTGMMDMTSFKVDDAPTKCPLHGKNCPPKKSK